MIFSKTDGLGKKDTHRFKYQGFLLPKQGTSEDEM